ncbi:hypothetical protein K3495_g8826 [Podosphaera aphanis]|nr:hypothetical protein K3495_g8826 [Podosphaera aphanis]
MKKVDDKWAGPYKVLSVYPRACRVELPEGMKIFPVLQNSLLRRKDENSNGLPGDDEEIEVEKWEFTEILDVHDDLRPGEITYLVKWKHQKRNWQIAADLKGQERAILKFHEIYPKNPGPPAWVRLHKPQNERISPAGENVKIRDSMFHQKKGQTNDTKSSIFTRQGREVKFPLRYSE